MKTIAVRSYAKINLGHEILGRRDDGYHEVRTILQTIDLTDRLTFERRDAKELSLKVSGRSIPEDRPNLVLQAAEALQKQCDSSLGARITLEKRIPVGAGLGGGSSNASCTIFALSRLWDLDFPPRAQHKICRSLGCDVPFFRLGGTALGIARGDEIYPLADLSPLWTLILAPPLHISAEEAYRRHGAHLTTRNDTSTIKGFVYDAISPHREWGFLHNDFESTIFSIYPKLKELKEQLLARGAQGALLSGSGSSVFGLFEEKARALKARKFFQQTGGELEVFLVQTVDRLSYQRSLNESFR